MVPRSTHLNPVCIPLGTGLRSVRLRGNDGLGALSRTHDISVGLPPGFRMDLVIGSVEHLRVSQVAASPFISHWPGKNLVEGTAAFLLPLEGALTLESARGRDTVAEGGLILSEADPAVVSAERPSRFLVLVVGGIGVDQESRFEVSRSLPPSSMTATARTVLRAFLADLDVHHRVQTEYLQTTVMSLFRLLVAEREDDDVDRLCMRDMVDAAVQVVLADFADSALDPGGVARRCRVSLRSLQRAMAEERHTTLRELIASVRTQNALRLVGAPGGAELALNDIARKTGFSSTERLRRAIAAATGLSPTEYRRHLNADERAVG